MIKTLLKYKCILFSLIFLFACSPASNELNEESVRDTEVESSIEEQSNNTNNDAKGSISNEDQTYMEEKLSNSYFKEVDVDIQYTNDRDYEFEISRDDGKIEASVEDDLSGSELKGREAFDFIFDRMKDLSIDRNTSFDSLADQIVGSFKLDSDYVKFDVEITFQDGTKLEYDKE